MEPVLVEREKLIAKITANRAKHIATYEAALIGWRKKLAAALHEFGKKYVAISAKVMAGKDPQYPSLPHKPKPESYVKHYDQVIGMLKMSVEKTVKLNAQDYARYILDQWEWSEQFANSTVGYGGGGGGGAVRKRLSKVLLKG